MRLGFRLGLPLSAVPNGGDVTPAAFTFTDVAGATVATVYTSNTITISGLSAGVNVAVSITGGTYSLDGGAFVSTPGIASNGSQIAVRHTSSASALTATNTTLTVGGISDTFTTTTA